MLDFTSKGLKWMEKATERELIPAELWSSSPFMTDIVQHISVSTIMSMHSLMSDSAGHF